MLHLDTALAATAPELIAEQRKYYSGRLHHPGQRSHLRLVELRHACT